MYKLTNPTFGQTEVSSVIRTTDNAYIPFDPDNTDYQQYLKWVAEGGVPTPSDALVSPTEPLPADEGVA